MDSSLQPVVFVGHGSPLNAIEDTSFSRGWEELGKKISKPQAILAISAHWFTHGNGVNDAQNPKQIYDMFGFPKELYDIKYQPPGDPALAEKVARLIGGVKDSSFGIDHGVWSVLRRSYPLQDVPVVEMSVNGELSFMEMFALGKKLAPLREEGVLLLGSGSLVHNLSLVDWDKQDGYPWANAFQKRINQAVLRKDFSSLVHIDKDKDVTKAFRSVEHYAPLLYVLGALQGDEQVEIFNDQVTLGSISMTSYLFRS